MTKTDKRISVVLPVLAHNQFHVAMTEFAIKALRYHADHPFDLIVVEAEHEHFDPEKAVFYQGSDHAGVPVEPAIMLSKRDIDEELRIDKYIRFAPKVGVVREINAGIRAAETEFIVTAGNDVIVPPHWDTELLRCFEERKDCGLAAISALEPGASVGPGQNIPLIVEGMYSPFNMFRKGWEYDESYLRVYQDSDLVLRMYEAGLRSYRSCRAHLHHLLRMTNDNFDTAAHMKLLKRDEELFYQRWGKSPLAMFAMIRAGSYSYGNEFQSFLRPVGTPDHPANHVSRS
jgi:hypothetical protein